MACVLPSMPRCERTAGSGRDSTVRVLPDNRVMDKVWAFISLNNMREEWRLSELRADHGGPRGQLTHAYTRMLACSRGSRYIPDRSLSDALASRRTARSPPRRKPSFSSLTQTPVARRIYCSCKAPLCPLCLAASLSFDANGEPLWWKPFVWKCVCLL